MAKTIKFNLVCDGNSVRTLEDLRNNFSIEDVLEYYKNGLLLRWLGVRGFAKEYGEVEAINDKDDIAIIKRLIEIFDIETDENKVEEGIYILQHEYKRKTLLDRYKNSDNSLENTIDEYIQGYNRFVNFIINNNQDMRKIKAALREIDQHYHRVFELNYRNLFYRFKEEAPMALFAMLTIDGLREAYFPTNKENKEDEENEYIKRVKNDINDMIICIRNKSYENTLVDILKDNLKVFKGKTDQYWKDIEPKGKKCMILDLDYGCLVRSSGQAGEEFDSTSSKFLILDGIDYKSNNTAKKVLYMEV